VKSPAGPTELRCVRHAEPTGRRFGGKRKAAARASQPATAGHFPWTRTPHPGSGFHQPPAPPRPVLHGFGFSLRKEIFRKVPLWNFVQYNIIVGHVYVDDINGICVGVSRPGVPKPTSEMSPRPQPRWVDASGT
jgi:hypothetical protein